MNEPTSTKSRGHNLVPPPTKDHRETWSHQLNALVTQATSSSVERAVVLAEVQSANRWNMVRDIIVILLLITLLSFNLWRAFLVESRLQSCSAEGGSVLSATHL